MIEHPCVTIENGRVILRVDYDNLQQMRASMISMIDRFEFVRADADNLKLWIVIGEQNND